MSRDQSVCCIFQDSVGDVRADHSGTDLWYRVSPNFIGEVEVGSPACREGMRAVREDEEIRIQAAAKTLVDRGSQGPGGADGGAGGSNR